MEEALNGEPVVAATEGDTERAIIIMRVCFAPAICCGRDEVQKG